MEPQGKRGEVAFDRQRSRKVAAVADPQEAVLRARGLLVPPAGMAVGGRPDAPLLDAGRRVDEHLRLALQPPERLRVDDPVTVALEGGTDRALLLRVETAAALVLRRVTLEEEM